MRPHRPETDTSYEILSEDLPTRSIDRMIVEELEGDPSEAVTVSERPQRDLQMELANFLASQELEQDIEIRITGDLCCTTCGAFGHEVLECDKFRMQIV